MASQRAEQKNSSFIFRVKQENEKKANEHKRKNDQLFIRISLPSQHLIFF